MKRPFLAFALIFSPACVDPLVEDGVPPQDILWNYDPAASWIPTPREYAASTHDRPGVSRDLADEIDEYDYIDDPDGVAHRLSGFAGGARVWYWNFGWTPPFVAPLWALVDPFAEGGTAFVDHPFIWDVVPGDPAYSPFWRIYTVAITDKYQGERLLSRRAIDEAIEAGLILEPQATDVYANCPMIDEDVRMQIRPGSFPGWEEEPCPGNEDATCIAPHFAYYRGLRVAYFDTNGPRTFDASQNLPEREMYELRRESEALPLSEPERRVDITGDGDAFDTNDVFPTTPCDDEFTPVLRTTEVFVAPDYASIDTNADETQADARGVSDLFAADGTPRTGVVRGLQGTDRVANMPVENLSECP